MINNDAVCCCKEVPVKEQPLKKLNTVSNPSYYSLGGIEPFEYMRSKMTNEEFVGYLKCNIIKYVSRMGHKTINHDGISDHEDNRLLTTYDDACKIHKYADVLCKEVFRDIPPALRMTYAEPDEWLVDASDNGEEDND